MTLVKYAQSMISHVTYAYSACQCVTKSACYLIKGQIENDISSALLLNFDLFANTVVFGYGYFYLHRVKGLQILLIRLLHPSISK